MSVLDPDTLSASLRTLPPHVGDVRVAFCGASGTGKTTLATWLAEELGVPINPVGSRSVAKEMGFDSPYDVDAAGKRGEFQHRLVVDKRVWENMHASFVVDRTTLDNLVYTMLHDVRSIDAKLLEQIIGGMSRYTHVVYCPIGAFCKVGGDPSRVADLTYQKLFDVALRGCLTEWAPNGAEMLSMHEEELEQRKHVLSRCFRIRLMGKIE